MDCKCSGELIKLKKFYVCDECAKILSFDDIKKITTEQRGVLSSKPNGSYIEMTHPEYFGYYKFNVEKQTEWVTVYTLTGKNDKKVGVLRISDYTKSKYIDCDTQRILTTYDKKEDWIIPKTKSLKNDDFIIVE